MTLCMLCQCMCAMAAHLPSWSDPILAKRMDCRGVQNGSAGEGCPLREEPAMSFVPLKSAIRYAEGCSLVSANDAVLPLL